MRFATHFNEAAYVDSFIKTLHTIGRLGSVAAVRIDRQAMTFVQNANNNAEGRFEIHARLDAEHFFTDTRMTGMTATEEYFYISFKPMDAHKLLTACAHNAKDMRMRLTSRNGNAYLKFDIKLQEGATNEVGTVSHDVPVIIVKRSAWSDYQLADLAQPQRSVLMPPMRKIVRILQCYKAMHAKHVTIAVNESGALEWRTSTDKVTSLTSYFGNLTNYHADEGAQEGWENDKKFASVRVDIKALITLCGSPQLQQSRFVLGVVHHRLLILTLDQDDIHIRYTLPGVTFGS